MTTVLLRGNFRLGTTHSRYHKSGHVYHTFTEHPRHFNLKSRYNNEADHQGIVLESWLQLIFGVEDGNTLPAQ